ncbi:amino acid permease [SAR92 clade bacterium H231]|jgi:APA family basic amino acid/polyamine antiporter|nr:amino acid permease [Porticoccaceae bacterium]MCT2532612.1 amino acid permease [SAR92 clade bacterium H231]MDA7815954.1 amino acid permease [Porticoccaceae bacterium]MDA8902917.1 amino acid permease [Porticoccaceae bacterium]MDA9574483.1 amino acid permease [Porticoccaceae bacterium]
MENNNKNPSAHKEIGFWRGWSIAVGCAIGSGVFMMPTLLAPYGMLGLAGWLIAGGGTLLVALSLSRLVRRIPKIGGPYAYVQAGLGSFAGFLIAWTYWIACIAAVSGIAIAFVGYLGVFVPQITDSRILSLLCALALVWSIVMLNVRSLESSSRFQLVSTLIKILPLLFMIILGFSFMEPANLPEVNPTDLHPAALLATVTTLVMWSFVGIETATVPADNMVEPEKTIPRVLVAAVLSILTIYLLVSMAVALLVPADELMNSTAPFALAASKVMGPAGAALITLGALVSTLGSLNANTLTAGNVALAAAKDNLLPEQFKRLSDSGTPQFAYIVSGLFISALLTLNYTKGLVAAFTFMAMLSTLSTLMAYAFCAVAEFYFLKSDQPGPERTRAIGLSIATFTYAFFAIYGAGWEIVFYSFMLILMGMPIYALVKK